MYKINELYTDPERIWVGKKKKKKIFNCKDQSAGAAFQQELGAGVQLSQDNVWSGYRGDCVNAGMVVSFGNDGVRHGALEFRFFWCYSVFQLK